MLGDEIAGFEYPVRNHLVDGLPSTPTPGSFSVGFGHQSGGEVGVDETEEGVYENGV
jgi:hypothetical protein